jgi:hypothetical protein
MCYKAETRLTAQWEQVQDMENTFQTTVIVSYYHPKITGEESNKFDW